LLRKKITIVNKLGLHARAAAKLVHLASRYASEILLIKNDQRANGKSIMGVMMLAAAKGIEIELEVEGEDEAVALEAVENLINGRFGESE
jgi:phosphocarrier protein HPr